MQKRDSKPCPAPGNDAILVDGMAGELPLRSTSSRPPVSGRTQKEPVSEVLDLAKVPGGGLGLKPPLVPRELAPASTAAPELEAPQVLVDVIETLPAPAKNSDVSSSGPPSASLRVVGFEEAPTGETPKLPSWRPRQSLPAQATYGRFELLGRIARGGMAEILLARERTQLGVPRHVVVKRILPTAADDEGFVRMFLDEARLLMGLAHPEICHVYDFGKQDGTWFIAMEWVNGAPLAKIAARARKKGGLPPQLVARVIAQVAGALHAAHTAKDPDGKPLGIVHRDVSPHNIMVAYDGSVKLLDFGIAKATLGHDRTRAGVIKGKFAYMAPEQCVGGDLDARADVFALGICLYESLTGRALFRRATEYETLKAVVQDAAPPLRKVDASMPEGLERILKKALDKKRENRYRSAQEMQLALEGWLAEERQVVTGANLARMMRRLFSAEIRKGPDLSPIAAASPSNAAIEIPDVEIEEETAPSSTGTVLSAITGSLVAHRRPAFASLLVAVAALAIIAVVAFTKRAGEPEVAVAPPAVAPHRAAEPAAAAPAPPPEPSVVDEPSSPAVAATEPAPASAAARSESTTRASARLSLNTRPWSKVYVGSRLLGTTPIGNARVTAGRVTLRLVDRDGNTHRRTLQIAPGAHAQQFFELSE